MASSLRRGFLGIRKTLISMSMANQTSIAVSPLRSETRYRSHLDSITRFSSDAHSFGIDLSNEESKRRTLNKLLYRSKQRGFLELDLVLGKWVEENISTMDETGIKALVDVLDLENPDLWKWLTSQDQPPEELKNNAVFCGVREKVMRNLNSHASPETLATPGKPWVRGWDDLKRGRDSPISALTCNEKLQQSWLIINFNSLSCVLGLRMTTLGLNISKQLIPLKSVKLLDSLYEAENRIKKSGRGVSSDTPDLC